VPIPRRTFVTELAESRPPSAIWMLHVRCPIGKGLGYRIANGMPQVRCRIGKGAGERGPMGCRRCGVRLAMKWSSFF